MSNPESRALGHGGRSVRSGAGCSKSPRSSIYWLRPAAHHDDEPALLQRLRAVHHLAASRLIDGSMPGLDNQAGHLRQKQALEAQGRYATEDSTPRAVPLRVGDAAIGVNGQREARECRTVFGSAGGEALDEGALLHS